MAFEREAIIESSPATAPQSPIMREERTVDPYRVRAPKTPLSGSTEQRVISGEGLAETKTPEETVTLSPQMAALARKEQKSRQAEMKLKSDREALEVERAEVAELKAMKAKLAAKDYSGLEGQLSYEDYTSYLLNKQNSADPTQQALKKLEDEVTSIKKQSEDNLNKQFEAAVNERRVATTKLLATSEEFSGFQKKAEASLGIKMTDAVVQHILDTWEHDSAELSVEDASKEVKEVLIERAKKWSSILEPEIKAPVEGEKKQLPPMKASLKTITNQVTAGGPAAPRKSLQHLSDSERWAEARRRAEEKLQRQG